ncbi:MAG: type I-B CRISPR-associated protein Cas5b [Promethearchaeota archaeon]
MDSGKLLAFDLKGDYGFFRAHETTRSPLSYPFTRTSIIGIIAAIMGLERNSYWDDDHPLARSKIALELMSNPKKYQLTINYTQTKEILSLQSLKIYFPRNRNRGYYTAVQLDTLRNIHFRIYFYSENTELYNRLKNILENFSFVFPPYFGHANMLANIDYLGEFDFKVSKNNNKIDSVVATSLLHDNFINVLSMKISIIPSIPIRVIINDKKIINTIRDNFLIDDVEIKPWNVLVKNNVPIFSVDLSDRRHFICFMPTGFEPYYFSNSTNPNTSQTQLNINSTKKAQSTQKTSTQSTLTNLIDSNSKNLDPKAVDKFEVKNRQFLFIFDSRDCVPNGERSFNSTGPRFDSSSGKIIVTDVCIKRTVRDYIRNFYNNSNLKILVHKDEMTFIPLKKMFINDLQMSEDKLKSMDQLDLIKLICNKFVDVRLFGCLFALSGNVVGITGPVQLEIAESLNQPSIQSIKITTTLASVSGKKSQGTMGNYSFLNYAIILTHGIINPTLALKSNLKEDDIQILFKSLWFGTKSRITKTKLNQYPRLLVSIVYNTPFFQIPMLKYSIKLKNTKLSCFKQCIFDVTGLKKLLIKYKSKIAHIEFAEDPNARYICNQNVYNSFHNFIKGENINLNLINFNYFI